MSISFPTPNGPIRLTGPVAAHLRRSQTGGTPPPAADLAAGTAAAKEYLGRLVRPEYVSLPFRGPHDLDNWTGETWEIRRAYRALLLKEPAVKAALKSKVAAVASLTPQVLPEDKTSPKDRAAARFVDWAISRSHGGWPGVVRAVAAGALIDGFSLCEKVLAPVTARAWPGFWGLDELAPLDTRYVRLDVDPYKRVTAVRYVKGQAAQGFDPRDFTVYAYQALWGSLFGISDLRAAYRPAALIEAAVRLRAVLLENFAGPFLVGTYPTGDQGQKEELLAVLRDARATGYVVVPDGDEVQVLNLATSADAQSGTAIEDYRKEIYTAIRGAYLPFTEGAAGVRVGNSQVHQDVADLDAWDLAVDVAEVVNRQLIPDLVRPNFGDGVGLPRVSLGARDPGAVLKTLEVVKAVQAAGVPVSAAFIYEASGVEPPAGPGDVAGGNTALPPADRAFRQTEYVEADHPRDERGRWVEKGNEAEPGAEEVLADGRDKLISRLENGRPVVYFVRTKWGQETFNRSRAEVPVGELINVDGKAYIRRKGLIVPLQEVKERVEATGWLWQDSGKSPSDWDSFFESNKVDLREASDTTQTLRAVGPNRLLEHTVTRYGKEAAELVKLMKSAGYDIQISYSGGGAGAYRLSGRVIKIDADSGPGGIFTRSLRDASDKLFEALKEYRPQFEEGLRARQELADQVLGRERRLSESDDNSHRYLPGREEDKVWASNTTSEGPVVVAASSMGLAASVIPWDRLAVFLAGKGLRFFPLTGRIVNKEGQELAAAKTSELLGEFVKKEGLVLERKALTHPKIDPTVLLTGSSLANAPSIRAGKALLTRTCRESRER